jgi:hypothetical protein
MACIAQFGMNKQIYVTKALRSKSKDWVARNQDNVAHCSDIVDSVLVS